MASVAGTGELPAIPEDTIDLGERLDPIRTLLRRTAAGDERAAAALVDVLGPRIHGLAVHVTGSSARAEKLTVSVLRSCLRDAGDLAASGLPGEAAVLDRARRAAVATRPTGDVRSLAGPGPVADRTSDRREIEVLRVLLELPLAQRALVESAAQGRFAYSGADRQQAALTISRMLDALVPFGGPEDAETRGLSSLDALALADAGERLRLRELTRSPETAGIHRHAIEAAARLALLTAVPPSRDLRIAVLEGFGDRSRPAQSVLAPRGPAPSEPETAYSGSYSTPVLGTDTQRRVVGPPPQAGGPHGSATELSALSPPTPDSAALPPRGAQDSSAAPAFAFRSSDEKTRSRRDRRREKQRARAGTRRVPWISRSLAALSLIAALVLGGLLWDSHRRLEASESFSDAWADRSMAADAQLVPGTSDNGTWQAVLTDDGLVLRAEGVTGWDGEVLELWGEADGTTHSLGVLDLSADGTIEFTSGESVQRLVVTREMSPGNESGSPSSRVVADLDPEGT
ncbi:hypothetical protein CFK41_11170 [Brachybacterium ginsengisoli]|uniref:Uncharacterized protein n=1 Tax=Brachybacterium ginsengisoli TaxID=1331682 RepID=A0A291GYG9_9MICO|nr:hypothetical protein [Brachybacterium ginsengisoli]ATG55260.1 hypothetical protein CFK41_11170 [Brachybacterium ginsengisoli]